MANFLFADQNFNEISQNFQSIAARLGEWVTGNEKLFHVTGASGNVRRWFPNQTKLDCGFKNYEPNVMGFLICCTKDCTTAGRVELLYPPEKSLHDGLISCKDTTKTLIQCL